MLKFFLPLSLCSLTTLSAQLTVRNSGVDMTVDNGVELILAGALEHNSGTLQNNGNIHLQGDYSGLGTFNSGASSWLFFEGSANQTINNLSNLANLGVDNGNRLILGNSLTVTNSLDLMNNGSLELGSFDLTLGNTASITGYDASNYIVTNGAGSLKRTVGMTLLDFPVGNSSYNPAYLANAGTVDEFSVRITDEVLEDGTTGTAETTDIINRTWHIDEQTTGGSDVYMTLEWQAADQLTGFNESSCQVIHYNTSLAKWEYPSTPTAATNIAGTRQQSLGNVSDFSPFSIDDHIENLLAVELISFTAKRKDASMVDLNWITAMEENHKGFALERMLSSEQEFKELSYVESQGNSSMPQEYIYQDLNSHTRTSYYRLKMEDLFGNSVYSEIRAVNGIEEQVQLTLYPNPVVDQVQIQFTETFTQEEDIQVKLLSMSGQHLRTFDFDEPEGNVLNINNLDGLQAGVYVLEIQLSSGTQYQKEFIKK